MAIKNIFNKGIEIAPYSSEEGFESHFAKFAESVMEKYFYPVSLKKVAPCQESVKRVPDISGVCGEGFLIWNSPDSDTTRIHKCAIEALEPAIAKITNGPELLKTDIESCTHRLPVAFCLECGEEFASLPFDQMPEWMDRYLGGGLVLGRGIEIASAFTQEILVPADCRCVLEGYIQRSEEQRLFHVTCVTRKNS